MLKVDSTMTEDGVYLGSLSGVMRGRRVDKAPGDILLIPC